MSSSALIPFHLIFYFTIVCSHAGIDPDNSLTIRGKTFNFVVQFQKLNVMNGFVAVSSYRWDYGIIFAFRLSALRKAST